MFDHGPRRIAAAGFGAFVLLEVIAFLIAQVLVGGTAQRDPEAAVRRLLPAGIDGVVSAPGAKPETLKTPRIMGAQYAGVALVAASDLSSVRTESGERRAPIGGRLLGFRVADGVCEVKPCEEWRTLNPQVVIDGESQDLPGSGDTFVVTLPPGSHTVDLTIDADGYAQSVSVLDDYVDTGNIKLLGRPGQTEKQVLNKTFQAVERTSVPLQYPDGKSYDTFNRVFTVEYVQRRFFLNGQTPSATNKVFLLVNTFYSYAGQSQKYVVADEVTFVDERGTVYPARDMDPDEAVALIGFEIPADVLSGTLRVGGSSEKVAANGVSYTATLTGFELDLDLA